MIPQYDRPSTRGSPVLSSIGFVALCLLGSYFYLRHVSHRGAALHLQEIRRTGVAVVALANEPPSVIVQSDGSLAGMGPDIDRAVLKATGVERLSGAVMDYGAMIPALEVGRVDLVSSGSQDITPQRCAKVLFSNPVLCDAEGFLASASLAHQIRSYRDAARLGLRIGACGGCIEQSLALRAGAAPNKVIVFPDGVSAAKMLESDRLDLVALPKASLEMLERSGAAPRNTEIGTFEDAPISCSAASFRKQDTLLRDAYNRGLESLVASGGYARILNNYGYTSRIHLREGRTTAGLCMGR